MMRRRCGPDESPQRHRRIASDFTSNGESGNHDGMVYRGGALGGGKSQIRSIANAVRSRLRHMITAGRQQGLAGAVGFLAACFLMVWCGLQLPRLLEAPGGLTTETGRELQASGVAAAESSVGVGNLAPWKSHHAGPRLAYGIMVYQRKGSTVEKTLGQFTRMFDALYDEENTYVVHVDIKSDQALLDAVSKFLAGRDNAYQVRPVSVSWGGITVVERTLALMQKALEEDNSWRFFVNLGHEDYPSISQKKAREWMKEKPDGTNFIKCWPIEKHNFFGQTERHESRVKDVNVDDFTGGVKEYRSLGGKPGSQERPQTEYKFYKSLQQTMLSRQLTDYAVSSSEARRLLLYMATSKAPDELYFPTLTQLDQRFSTMATCDDTRHFSYWIRPGGSWHPEYLTLDHLPLVLQSEDFYIRKISPSLGSEPLLDVLDMLRAERPLDDALPVIQKWLNRDGENGTRLGAPGGPITEFTEGTVSEAIAELNRRVSEDTEAKRCMFKSFIGKRGAQMRLFQSRTAGGANAVGQPTKNEGLGLPSIQAESRKPFLKLTAREDVNVEGEKAEA